MMRQTNPLPPLELLEQLINYDPESGMFRWKVNRSRTAKIGAKAGSINNKGYVKIEIQGKQFAAHRLAWFLLTKINPKNTEIDHINGNKSDNRACNLRLATRLENSRNRTKLSNNTSGFKGVHFCNRAQKYKAQIGANGKRISLGYFDTPELAHMAYCKAAAELHGEFARGQ